MFGRYFVMYVRSGGIGGVRPLKLEEVDRLAEAARLR